MALFDVTNKTPVKENGVTIYRINPVKPRDAESYNVIQKVLREVGAVRFRKDCAIIDAAVSDLVTVGLAGNKFIFTKAGFLVGHQSVLPHVDVNHVWESAEMGYSTHLLKGKDLDLANEYQLRFVGGLVRWRISLRDETWVVYRRDSGKYNMYTGDEITISEYWIPNNPNLKFEAAGGARKRGFSIDDLKGKFNSSKPNVQEVRT